MAKKKAKAKKKAIKRTGMRSKAKPARAMARPAKRKTVVKKAAAPSQPARSKALGPGYLWLTPMLTVRNMPAAIDFYKAAFGFKVRATMPGPDGKLMHAELLHKDSVIMLGPENQQMGSFAPQGPSPITLYIFVEDVDKVAQRAAGAGGTLAMPVSDMFWGDRCGVVVDPEGHSWMIATHIKDMTADEMMEAMQASPPPVM